MPVPAFVIPALSVCIPSLPIVFDAAAAV